MDKSGVGTFVTESHELATSNIDLFSMPSTEVTQIHGRTVTIYPSNVLVSEGPFEFLIPPSSDFTFLPLTRLEGEIEIEKLDGTPLTDNDCVSYVNLLPQSLFRQVEVYVKDMQINDLSTPTYSYKAFLETHLSYNNEMKTSTLKACEYYDKDIVGKENELLQSGMYAATYTDKNVFKERAKRIQGKKLPFSMVLHSDFLQSNRYLLPDCPMTIKLIRNEDKFSLFSSTVKAKIKINKLKLSIRRITIDPSITQAIETKLRNGEAAIYPLANSKIKTHLINSGRSAENISQIFTGQLPRTVIVCFVKDKSYNGSVDTNPFVFEPFKLNYLNLLVDGEPITSRVFQPDYDNNDAIREYRWLLDNLGQYHIRSNGLTYEEFKSNSNFYVFDMSPDLCNNFEFHGNVQSTVDLQVGFKESLTENVTCLIYATFNEILTMDADRKVAIV